MEWSEFFGGARDFLKGGIDIAKDFQEMKNGPQGNVPYMGNPDAFSEYYLPQDAQVETADTSTSTAGQWVPGVSNSVVLIGGLGAVLVLAVVARG